MRKIIILLMLLWSGISIHGQDEYNPTNPGEPYARYKLTVSATPTGYVSGGGMYLLGDQVTVNTSASSQDYTFSHWTKNGTFYTDEPSFTYTITSEITKLEAVYDFTPVNPAEPVSNNQFRLYLTNNITQACSFNRTSGAKAEVDEYVYVQAYPNSGYDFLGWYENGVKVSDELAFNYMMGNASATLTARFAYNPVNPDEPASAGGSDIANTKEGDVNGDGVVNVMDAIALIGRYLQNTTEEIDTWVGDVNKDGTINVMDAIEIINRYLNNQ